MSPPPLDARLTPARSDLAARQLEGRVESARFVDGDPHRVSTVTTALRVRPEEHARQVDELLWGEGFTVYDSAEGWAWGQATANDYVGYLRRTDITPGCLEPTHRVSTRMTHVYPAPDLKSGPTRCLSLGSRLCVSGESKNGFLALDGGGWLFAAHLAPLDRPAEDFVAVAESLLGTPYLWGGRSAFGLDCSGLVELALDAAGHRCPRDSDLQASSLGRPLPIDGTDHLQRGDLAFFPGHVGIMRDSTSLLHAVIWGMAVTTHPLAQVIERIGRKHARPLRAIRRLAKGAK